MLNYSSELVVPPFGTLAMVKVNENDMRFWARQYASQIKITEPKELVDMCKQDMVNALALYQN